MLKKILQGDCLEIIKNIENNSIDACVTDPPYGLSFMGKHWDYDVPKVEIWKEVLRVLKPGGYLLSFAGTRTQHRMACNIEDAGFEIRDMIAWVYGSGFPKSLNIGKQEGCSDFEGWGTALKPALEPITMARKPLSGKTVAENCLKFGTGGINIDGCRVEFESKEDYDSATFGRGTDILGGNYVGAKHGNGKTNIEANPRGRFPANLIHDGSQEVLDLFPDSKSGAMLKPYKYTNNGFSLGKPTGETKQIHEASQGSASRFFYCAKASKSERDLGCDKLPLKSTGNFDDDNYKWDKTKGHVPAQPRRNNHPTVKPIRLMEYLVKLVSKENAIILDPFAGSGTTGIACQNLNRQFILIERDENYCQIIKARLTKID